MGAWTRALASWRIAGMVLALSVLGALGGAYALFVDRQGQYLTGRNFRLLAGLDTQIENTLDAEAKVLKSLVTRDARDEDGDGRCPDVAPAEASNTGAKDPFGNLRTTWGCLHRQRYDARDLAVYGALPVADPTVSYTLNRARPSLRLDVRFLSASGGELGTSFPLAPLFDPLFESRVRQGAYDTIVLARADGTVAYGFGEHAHDLEAGGLAPLVAPPGDARPDFTAFARRSMTTTVLVDGASYKLYTQPCCTGADPNGPWVLAGLVTTERFNASSWAISTSIVKGAMLSLLILSVAWPFLRLTLLGDRQRVRVTDVVHLLASAVGGLAIVTLAGLDAIASRALTRDIEVQLDTLSQAIRTNVEQELSQAHAELSCGRRILDRLSGPIGDRTAWGQGAVLATGASCDVGNDSSQAVGAAYPYFDSMAFIDATGQQRVKFWGGALITSRVPVGGRTYFKDLAAGRGWSNPDICGTDSCTFESVWAWTTGEPLGVLAVTGAAARSQRDRSPAAGSGDPPGSAHALPFAAISIPMRSLVWPILPRGFEFAIIDESGAVLFHSDPLRNNTENFFTETDGNRRLRAEVAAHSAEALSLRYGGEPYRAFVRPLTVPRTYVVALAQSHRTWAINREWLIVALLFFALQFALWIVMATLTIVPRAPWLWPDPRRGPTYATISAGQLFLLGLASAAMLQGDRRVLVPAAIALPLIGWGWTWWLLRWGPLDEATRAGVSGGSSAGFRTRGWWTLSGYPPAAVLVLLVTGSAPAALLFETSYRLHAESYTRSTQLGAARAFETRWQRIDDRFGTVAVGTKQVVAHRAECLYDLDVYAGIAYRTVATRDGAEEPRTDRALLSSRCPGLESSGADPSHDDHAAKAGDDHSVLLSLLEDYLPYYSDASIEWRELLHGAADDGSWVSHRAPSGELATTIPRLGLTLRTFVPSLVWRLRPGTRAPVGQGQSDQPQSMAGGLPQPVGTSGQPQRESRGSEVRRGPGTSTDRSIDLLTGALLVALGATLVLVAWLLVQIFLRQVFLVDVEPPLWTTMALAASTGDNVFVICDETSRRAQLEGFQPLRLSPLVRRRNGSIAWRREMRDLDRRSLSGSPVIIDDLDESLDDVSQMAAKLHLLDALVADPFRTVVVVSFASPAAVSDALRATGNGAAESASALWTRMLPRFTVIDRRAVPLPGDVDARGPAAALIRAERASHPYVARICDDILRSPAYRQGLLTRRQIADEIVERAAPLYRRIWQSCSEDEQVVLNHVAQHGLVHASVRGVVRRLLGRGLLRKDPALRTMSDTFCQFVLSKECAVRVSALETAGGRSAWDRLRAPLAIAVVAMGVFLFVTQKELYNAILGVTTAAAVSVPALIRTVGQLAGRREAATGDKA